MREQSLALARGQTAGALHADGVGPGTLDQELQEPKGLHQNQITSKKPPDSKGNQEAEMAAAKGLLPHEDHRRTKS